MAQANSAVIEILAEYSSLDGALLPILHRIQNELGFIPAESVAAIAKALNLSRAEVHGVISFYHQFREQPGGRHRVQICRAEACQSMGARNLEAHAKQLLGVEYGETTTDGAITLDAVYCLGNCACSPSVRIDDEIHARVTEAQFDALISELKSAEANS